MLVNMKKMLDKAKSEKYAVPHFNINNLEWTRFILEKCNELSSPVILGVSEGAMKYMGGFKTISNMVKNLIDFLDIKVQVSLHLDHGSSFDMCKNAIDAGFTSVMIDASKYPLDKNILITKEVVDYAKKHNVTVEAEIGQVGSSDSEKNSGIVYADVMERGFCAEIDNAPTVVEFDGEITKVIVKGVEYVAFDEKKGEVDG